MTTLVLTKCAKCGHDIDDHIVEDDLSYCVGECIDSTTQPHYVYLSESTVGVCPCKRYIAKDRPVQ